MKTLQIIKRWLAKLFSPRKKKIEIESVKNRKRIARGVKKFFEKNYELRFNVLKQYEEFRPRHRRQAALYISKAPLYDSKGPLYDRKAPLYKRKAPLCDAKGPLCDDGSEKVVEPTDWQQLTDRHLRRIAYEQMEQVGVAWSIDVELYVRSSLTPDYNPVADFLGRCGAWDGQTDHIRALARRVPTAYAEWPEVFHRWFLAMVAQWQQLSRDYGNALVPLLIGPQGCRKSTFCRRLLPPELRAYYIDDIKLDNAEQVERMLSRMLLVNVDEYNAKTEREQAKIKRVLTEKDVQTRRMRSDQYQLLPRMASFVATTNDRQPLCDPTGSRRYLCCEIDGIIDTTTPIDYRQLYAQAVDELRRGAPYHFTKAEEQAIEEHNAPYRCQTSPEALLLAYFEPAERGKDNFMRAVDIQHELEQHARAVDVPNLKKLTMALKACGFHHGSYKDQRGWYARRRENSCFPVAAASGTMTTQVKNNRFRLT